MLLIKAVICRFRFCAASLVTLQHFVFGITVGLRVNWGELLSSLIPAWMLNKTMFVGNPLREGSEIGVFLRPW